MATTPRARRPAPDRTSIPADTFERVIRAVNVAYYEWDLATDEMRASPALIDLYGHDPESFGRQRHRQLMHRDDPSAYRAATLAAFKSGADRLYTTSRLQAADGTYRWVRNQATLERDEAGRVTRMVGAVADITEAKQRDAENRALIARQAATIEVLKTISASPDDIKPVFDLIARRARELCDAQAVTVHEYDGTLLHLRAMDGYSPEAAAGLRQAFPRPPGRESLPGRTVLAGQVCHVHDISADPEIFQPGRALGAKSGIGVPLLREGRVIGTISLARFELKAFDESEVALVESFAEQAVIAIASATTLGELRQRTAGLQEALEYQTATSDVLKIISRSTFDL
jgi:PAS domain S-box-containing protein